ncbi:MAG TPA: 3-hydroxyacyl-CoA dehydrogenase family protein [Dehalococcoidales bacterium]|nr:3-hydroxyacyl-CoA dehydrogenase family protein [Dehalococcoidales bacterium]
MKKMNNILVVGAGTMGHGIAQSFAQFGYRVSLQDISPRALERSSALIKSSLNTMVEAGLVDKKDCDSIIGRIKLTTSLEEVAGEADLVVETIIENKEAKIDLFAKLDRLCPPHALLASNTSFFNIFDFIHVSRPDKLLMVHWYSPPQIVPLVDVVKGPQTSPENVQSIVDLLRGMNKKPIVFNKPLPGYMVTRLQVAFQREVYWMMDNGYLSCEDIDEASIWGLALRMMVVGICQRIDFGGLDISAKAKSSIETTPPEYKPVILNELVNQGCLGVKTGKGFYDYKGKSEAEVCHQRDVRLLRLIKTLQENDIAGPISV